MRNMSGRRRGPVDYSMRGIQVSGREAGCAWWAARQPKMGSRYEVLIRSTEVELGFAAEKAADAWRPAAFV